MAFHSASGARYILSNLCSCLFHVLREQTAGSPFGLVHACIEGDEPGGDLI